MVKPGTINKKKNVFHGNHKSKKRRALKGRAPELPETKGMCLESGQKYRQNVACMFTYSLLGTNTTITSLICNHGQCTVY